MLNDDGCRIENAGLYPRRLGLDLVILDSLRITCAVSADAISSRSDSSACDISGLIELKLMSVSVVGAKLWNELDSNLRNTKTILLFKKKFKWGVLPTYISHD